MNIALYVLAGVSALGALMTIGSVGKPRKPTTPSAAVGSVIGSACCITILVIAAGRLG